ncbi:MAG: superoxide dismutase [Cu-Zn] SodC [Pseudomonadota bacterium]
MKKSNVALLSMMFCAGSAIADATVQLSKVDAKGVGASVGQVIISASEYGLVFTPKLTGLAPGIYGFHIHEYPSCDPKNTDGKMEPALGAGGHYDPKGAKRHGTPWGDGHLGDLPALFVDVAGNASQPVLAPRLKMADIAGRSLMVHMGADNHSDQPAPLGGGGARMACGIIK